MRTSNALSVSCKIYVKDKGESGFLNAAGLLKVGQYGFLVRFVRYRNDEFRSFAEFGSDFDFPAVDHYCMFDDGKPQTCASDLSAAAFVHSVESLEDPFPALFWDADSVILYAENSVES